MSDSIEDTLRELDAWFQDVPGGSERPRLLSKLAMLEYCGWVEHRIDDIVRNVSGRCGIDVFWVEKTLISKTYGFKYDDHFRPMLCSVLGGSCVERVEKRLNQESTAFIERLRQTLVSLSLSRNSLAHSHFAGMNKQIILNAPSWCLNQQRITAKILIKYAMVVVAEAVGNTESLKA
jgi:hypothetical protein